MTGRPESISGAPGDVDVSWFGRLTNPFPEACLLVSASGDLVAQNARARQLLGTAVGSHLSDLITDPPEHLASYLAKCSGSGALLPGRLSFPEAGGGARRFRCEGAVVRREGDGRPALIMLRLRGHEEASQRFLVLNRKVEELSRELHERMRVEEALQQQTDRMQEKATELETALAALERQKRVAEEANRRKSEFLASMSHELRTPLHGIVGYANLLESGVNGPLSTEQGEHVDRMRRAAEHLTAIIQTILTFSSLDAGKERPRPEEVEAGRLASEALELVRPAAMERGLGASLHLPGEPILLWTDPAKVRQILLNLLSNAVKFTEAGEVSVTLRTTGAAVTFEVRDTGVGIEEEDIEKVFDPFWQVERGLTRGSGGTGLGLTVTRQLAGVLGGELEVESEAGQGSTFTLRLPLRRRAAS